MTYNIKKFVIEKNSLYAIIILKDKSQLKMHIPVDKKIDLIELSKKYTVVSNAHIIDEHGVGTYQPRLYRPFVPLPEGIKLCKQWEFDRHWAENPDPCLTIDINALVWNEFNKIS